MEQALDASGEQASSRCLNCGFSARPPGAKFCPHCSQETRARTPTVGEFVHEFVGNYLALEGALWRTPWLLLRQRGALTNPYLAGRDDEQHVRRPWACQRRAAADELHRHRHWTCQSRPGQRPLLLQGPARSLLPPAGGDPVARPGGPAAANHAQCATAGQQSGHGNVPAGAGLRSLAAHGIRWPALHGCCYRSMACGLRGRSEGASGARCSRAWQRSASLISAC